MKKIQLTIFSIIIALNISAIYSNSVDEIDRSKHAITYKPCKTRFGDQICGYSRTKWLSYKYKLPFLFIPFQYSEELTMFNAEKHASEELAEFVKSLIEKMPSNEFYSKSIVIEKESQLITALKNAKSPTLFICKFKTRLDRSCTKLNGVAARSSDMQTYLLSLQKSFNLVLKKMLKPIKQISIKLPNGCVTVAVHVRAGSGHDPKRISQQYYDSKKYKYSKSLPIEIRERNYRLPIDVNYPTKVPPNQYFIDQIISLSNFLGNIPLFIHIFTDESDKVTLMGEFKKRVNLSNITWSCRTECSTDDFDVIEDYYAMSQFDCLIRSASSFSLAASMLGSHKIIISPKHARWVNEKILIIDTVNIIIRNLDLNRRDNRE